MSWVATAIGGAALVGAVGSNMAAGTQASGQKAAAATQQNMFNTITGQEQPFLQGGYGAETSLSNLLGYGTAKRGSIDPSTGLPVGYLTQPFNPTQQQLENYPGYKFQLAQGDLALQSGNAPNVGAMSGPALKSLMSFNQGLAGTNYQNYFNQDQTQKTNIFNRLNQIAGLGQNAAGNLGNAGTSLGTGIAQAQAGAAASQAGGIVGATNSLGGSGVPLAYLMANNQQQGINNPDSGAFSAQTGTTSGSAYQYLYGTD